MLTCVAGDWVLVHAAAGGTGQLLTQICSHVLAAKVIGTTSTPEKAEVAKNCGAQEVGYYCCSHHAGLCWLYRQSARVDSVCITPTARE